MALKDCLGKSGLPKVYRERIQLTADHLSGELGELPAARRAVSELLGEAESELNGIFKQLGIEVNREAGVTQPPTQSPESAAAAYRVGEAATSPTEAIVTPAVTKSTGAVEAQRIAKMSPEEFAKFHAGLGKDAVARRVEIGRTTDKAELERLADQADSQAQILSEQAMGSRDPVLLQEALSESVKAQFFREAISESRKAESGGIVAKLESMKFKGKSGLGPELFTLRPDILQKVGKQLWNDAIDLAIAGVKAGRTIAQAIDAAIQHLKNNVRDFREEKDVRSELSRIIEQETKPSKEVSKPQTQVSEAITEKPVTEMAKPGFFRTFFTAEGALPKKVYDAWVKSRGEVASKNRQISYNVRDLKDGLRKLYDVSKVRELAAGLKDVPNEMVDRINRALLGEVPIESLPHQIQSAVRNMRQHVDELSQTLIDRGLIDEDLAAKVGSNLGTYLTRSFRIFDDPKWVEKIPVDVRKNAESYLAQSKNLSPEQAQTLLREMLADWSHSGLDKQFRRGKLGSKDLTQFMKRKDLPSEIRAVLGEYKDPVINYARSVTKLARFIGDQEFLNQVRSEGLGKFLFESGKSKPGFDAELAAEGSSVMSPLNGLRTSPTIKKAFETFEKSDGAKGTIVRTYYALNAISKMAKTVFSPLTQARNLTSQIPMNIWNGHFNFQDYGKSFKAVAADIGVNNSRQWRDYYLKLKRLGVVHESARAEELRAVLRDAGLKDLDFEGLSGETLARTLRKTSVDAPARIYQLSDELGKIVGFEAEKAAQKRAHPDWTETRIESEAAERVRNGYPTYSKVPRSIRGLRKQFLVGPFISFPYEIMRTSFHGMRYAAEDMASGNPQQIRSGIQRAAGMLIVLASGNVLKEVGKSLLGLDDKKEEDVRRFAAPWDKKAQLVFINQDKDTVDYINWSYVNPYSYLSDPVNAMFDNNEIGILNRTVGALGEFMQPFVNEQMLAAAILDVQRNKTQSGRPVYNPQDTPDEKITKSLTHLLTSIEPGITYRARTKIIPAALQQQPDYGRELNLKLELTSEFTGFKQQRMNFSQAIGYKIRQFSRDVSDANVIFSSLVGRTGSVPNDKLVDAYQTANEQRFKLWREMYLDIQAAKRNGVSELEILDNLKGSGLSKKDTNDLLDGHYAPLRITDEMRDKADKFKRILPESELDRIYSEMDFKPLAPVK